MLLSKNEFEEKVNLSLECARMVGNMYCGSVYAGLVSLISQQTELVLYLTNSCRVGKELLCSVTAQDWQVQ